MPSVSASSEAAKPPSGVRSSRSRNSAVSAATRTPSPSRCAAPGARRTAAATRCRTTSSRSAARSSPASTRVPRETAGELVVQAAAGHRVGRPSTMDSATADPVRSWWRSRNSSTIDGGNFGAAPNPPLTAVAPPGSFADRAGQHLVVHNGLLQRRRPARRGARRSAARPRSSSSGRSCHASVPRQAAAGTTACPAAARRVVGAAVERLAVRGEEAGHRPAALAGHRLRGGHVDGVDVRPFLAVDLDVDEVRVHQRRRSPRPRTTRAPSRGTSGRRRSRPTAGSARSGASASASASGPHGHQSTGLSACWSRYGLVAAARRFGIP